MPSECFERAGIQQCSHYDKKSEADLYKPSDSCADIEPSARVKGKEYLKTTFALTTVADVTLTCMKYLISIKTEIMHQVLQIYC